MTYDERIRCQEGLTQWCAAQHANYFLTLRFNNQFPLSPDRAERSLRHFDAQLDRKFLGGGWASVPASLRTRFIAIPEGRPTGSGFRDFHDVHYHLIVHTPPARKSGINDADLRAFVGRAWRNCEAAGDVNLQALLTDEDRRQVASYACKDVWRRNSVGRDRFVIAPMAQAKSIPAFGV